MIDAGDGDNVVIAGLGNDSVNTLSGADVIAADNVLLSFENGALVSLESTSLDSTPFGNDQVNAGNGNNIVVGGGGDDDLTVGIGDDFVFGDNVVITLSNKVPVSIASIDRSNATGGNDRIFLSESNKEPVSIASNDRSNATGGNDRIFLSDGRDQSIGGAGDDQIINSSGESVIIGDNGQISNDASGRYIVVQTGNPEIGGNDVLEGGRDNDVILGGAGNDKLSGNEKNDLLVGDAGKATRNLQNYIIESTDFFTGGADTLSAGTGTDILIGGFGDDLFVSTYDDDLMFGEYARVKYSVDELGNIQSVQSAITLAQGELDLARKSQTELYNLDVNAISHFASTNTPSLLANNVSSSVTRIDPLAGAGSEVIDFGRPEKYGTSSRLNSAQSNDVAVVDDLNSGQADSDVQLVAITGALAADGDVDPDLINRLNEANPTAAGVEEATAPVEEIPAEAEETDVVEVPKNEPTEECKPASVDVSPTGKVQAWLGVDCSDLKGDEGTVIMDFVCPLIDKLAPQIEPANDCAPSDASSEDGSSSVNESDMDAIAASASSGLLAWAAMSRQDKKAIAQGLDRSHMSSVIAKAKAKRFVSWDSFRL